jgi:hypothetical protein
MSLIMLAALGSFPASVAVADVLIHRFGPAIFFPVAGIVLAITVLASLTQREIRDFGMAPAPAEPPAPAPAEPPAPGPAESPAPGPAEPPPRAPPSRPPRAPPRHRDRHPHPLRSS